MQKQLNCTDCARRSLRSHYFPIARVDVSEVEQRESAHEATCKSEDFNRFVSELFFYSNGSSRENLRHAQNKMIAYNRFIAKLVIRHRIDSMSKATRKRLRQGFKADVLRS